MHIAMFFNNGIKKSSLQKHIFQSTAFVYVRRFDKRINPKVADDDIFHFEYYFVA